jgi:hypothetical protein
MTTLASPTTAPTSTLTVDPLYWERSRSTTSF